MIVIIILFCCMFSLFTSYIGYDVYKDYTELNNNIKSVNDVQEFIKFIFEKLKSWIECNILSLFLKKYKRACYTNAAVLSIEDENRLDSADPGSLSEALWELRRDQARQTEDYLRANEALRNLENAIINHDDAAIYEQSDQVVMDEEALMWRAWITAQTGQMTHNLTNTQICDEHGNVEDYMDLAATGLAKNGDKIHENRVSGDFPDTDHEISIDTNGISYKPAKDFRWSNRCKNRRGATLAYDEDCGDPLPYFTNYWNVEIPNGIDDPHGTDTRIRSDIDTFRSNISNFSGYNCDFYAKFFCKDGYPDLDKHTDMFGILNNWPELNCCACGGGIRKDLEEVGRHKYEMIDKSLNSVLRDLHDNDSTIFKQSTPSHASTDQNQMTIPYSDEDDTDNISFLANKYTTLKSAINACNEDVNCTGIMYIATPITIGTDDTINAKLLAPDYHLLKANIHNYARNIHGLSGYSYSEDNRQYDAAIPTGAQYVPGSRTFTIRPNGITPTTNFLTGIVDFRGTYRLLDTPSDHGLYDRNDFPDGVRNSTLEGDIKTIILKKQPLDFGQNLSTDDNHLEIDKDITKNYAGESITTCGGVCDMLADYSLKSGVHPDTLSNKRSVCCNLNVCGNHITEADCNDNTKLCVRNDGQDYAEGATDSSSKIHCGTNYGLNPDLSCNPDPNAVDACTTKTCCYKKFCKPPHISGETTSARGHEGPRHGTDFVGIPYGYSSAGIPTCPLYISSIQYGPGASAARRADAEERERAHPTPTTNGCVFGDEILYYAADTTTPTHLSKLPIDTWTMFNYGGLATNSWNVFEIAGPIHYGHSIRQYIRDTLTDDIDPVNEFSTISFKSVLRNAHYENDIDSLKKQPHYIHKCGDDGEDTWYSI